MLTNSVTGIGIDEVASGIYRINTPLQIDALSVFFPTAIQLGTTPPRKTKHCLMQNPAGRRVAHLGLENGGLSSADSVFQQGNPRPGIQVPIELLQYHCCQIAAFGTIRCPTSESRLNDTSETQFWKSFDDKFVRRPDQY